MLELPPVVKNVAIDPDLSPGDTRIYIVASQFLNSDEYRPLKLRAIAMTLGVSVSTIHYAMRRLCEQGYVDRGPRTTARGSITFRLTPYLIALG